MIIVEETKEFIRRLPSIEGEPMASHLLLLAIRSRFAKLLLDKKIKDLVVERKIVRSNSNWRDIYLNKVHNLSVLAENGRYFFNDIQIEPRAFGIFGTISPRNARMAALSVVNGITRGAIIHDKESEEHYIPRCDIKFFGQLHKHRIKTDLHLVTVDVDNPDILSDARDALSPFDKWMITKTSRGYHIILRLNKETARLFYMAGGVWDTLINKYRGQIELQRDPQEPIPGTLYMNPSKLDTPNFVTIIE